MIIFRNKHGQWFRSGPGGTYPINDGDPQNEVEDFDPEATEKLEQQQENYYDRRA